MNSDLEKLQPYPFEKMAGLHAGIIAPRQKQAITLAIGEPRHSPPGFIAEEIMTHLHGLSRYPLTRGTSELRQAIKTWLMQRFSIQSSYLDIDRNILPVNGTREALFAFAQCIVDRNNSPLVVMPNPFYQIYEGAALLAGAEPWYLNTTAETRWLPDYDQVPAEVWDRCQLLYLCTPGNPTGAVANEEMLQQVIQLADKHDFIIAADECYSEIYLNEKIPPVGLLETAAKMGNTGFRRCVAFHSLSKRSNVPGLRSGFVAGDDSIIDRFFKYRTYHGCAMPPYHQAASIKAWADEQHVINNRALYREKFDAVLDILTPVLEVERPAASFYLWPRTPIDDTEFSCELYARQNVIVLPGSYLSRNAQGVNPGNHRIRIALVAPLDDCIQAAERIKEFVITL